MAQEWNPRRYSQKASFVFKSVSSLTALLAPRRGTSPNFKFICFATIGERILDLGCGSGELTRAFVDMGCEVIGIDSSDAMVSAAKKRGVDARVMDAHDIAFISEFDAVFSNAALHWMRRDPKRIVQSLENHFCFSRKAVDVHRSLKPGGRFVAEFGGEGNVEDFVKATTTVLERRGLTLRSPWYFPSKEAYMALLESEGFEVKEASLFPRDTPFPSGPVGWLEIFGEPLLEDIPSIDRQEIFLEIAKEMEPLKLDSSGTFFIGYRRLQILAVTSPKQ